MNVSSMSMRRVHAGNRRRRIPMKRMPLKERLASAEQRGLSPSCAACAILDMAVMPLSDYFADIKAADSGYLEFLRRLRGINGTICDEAGFASTQVDGSTTVAQMAVMLRDLLDACPVSLRQHPREECDAVDGIMSAVEWFSVPLERAFEEFDQEHYAEAVKTMDAAKTQPKNHATVIQHDSNASEPAVARVPLEQRLRDAKLRLRAGVAAYGPGSPVFDCAYGVTMDNMLAGYQLLVGADAVPTGPVLNAMFELGLDSGTVPGCALSEQTIASDPYGGFVMGTPDLSDYMDHDRDLHVVAFVRPMAALADCGRS